MSSGAAGEWVAVAVLAPWLRNPRYNDKAVAGVARSIKRFGFGAPIVANLHTREIIAGHTRLQAAKRLGLAEVPVRWLELSEAEGHALALADNKLGEVARWEAAKLADAVCELCGGDAALLEELGLSAAELRELGVGASGGDGGFDGLPEGRSDGRQATFNLSPLQAAVVRRAVAAGRQRGAVDDGSALALVAAAYLGGGHG